MSTDDSREDESQQEYQEAFDRANAEADAFHHNYERRFAELSPSEQAEYRESQQADIEHARRTGRSPWDALDEFVQDGVTYGAGTTVDADGVRTRTAGELAAEREYREPVYAELARIDQEKQAARQAAEEQRRAALSPQERAVEDAARAQADRQWAAVWGDDDADEL